MPDLDIQSEGSKSLDQREHSVDANAKRVILRYFNSLTGEWENYVPGDVTVTERYDYAGNPIYVGAATVGTADGDPGWTITRYNLASSSNATGMVATDVSWDDRASGDYQ